MKIDWQLSRNANSGFQWKLTYSDCLFHQMPLVFEYLTSFLRIVYHASIKLNHLREFDVGKFFVFIMEGFFVKTAIQIISVKW